MEFTRSTHMFHPVTLSTTKLPAINPSLINYVPSIIANTFQSTFQDSVMDLKTSRSSVGMFSEENLSIESLEGRCEELWRAFRDEAGSWMSYRFTIHEWNEPKRCKSKRKEKLECPQSEEIEGGELTKEVIACSLSKLDRCPVFFHYSYIKCILRKKKLTDIKALASYHYLQYVDVSCNKLKTLEPLGNLPFLKYLDASRNLLTKILDFKAPHFLTTVNLSYNKFRVMRDLSDFWSITDLNLSRNAIRSIDGLLNLKYLATLNMSYNQIESIENLMHLRIQFLYLQYNHIMAFEDDNKAMLHTLNNIRIINLSHNQVCSLKLFEKVENLECLEVSFNHVSELLDVYYLRNLKYLNKLNLINNPVTGLRRYVEVCVTNVKNLVYLDGELINYDFWLQKLSNRIIDVSQMATYQRVKLLILEQLNKPQMWDWILPYDTPPLSIIVLVGLQASRKAHIAKKLCRENHGVVRGIPYTTRTKHRDEVEGDLYYYISEQEFRTMLKEGKFLTYQEHLGFYFGFAHTEFKKAENGILLFHTDLVMALCIRSKFLNAKLVLTLPSSRKVHMENLTKLYGVRWLDSGTMKIINSPAAVKDCELEFNENRRTMIEKDVKVIIDDLVTCVSKDRQFKFEMEEKKDSSIFHLWSAPYSQRIVRTSHRIPPTNHYYYDPDDSDSLETLQEDEPQGAKSVSFTDAKVLRRKQDKEEREGIELRNKSSQGGSDSPIDYDSSQETSEQLLVTAECEEEKAPEAEPRKLSEEMKEDDLSKLRYVPPSEPSRSFMEHDSYNDIISDDERIRAIFEEELSRREQLLELHWSTPGLFRELLLTDHEEETLFKLKQLAEEITTFNATKSTPMFDFTHDQNVNVLIGAKLKKRFKSIDREMSISEKQADEFFVDKEIHVCGKGDCRNPACPPFTPGHI